MIRSLLKQKAKETPAAAPTAPGTAAPAAAPTAAKGATPAKGAAPAKAGTKAGAAGWKTVYQRDSSFQNIALNVAHFLMFYQIDEH